MKNDDNSSEFNQFKNGLEINIINEFSNTNNEIIYNNIKGYIRCENCGGEAYKDNLCLECLSAEYGRSL